MWWHIDSSFFLVNWLIFLPLSFTFSYYQVNKQASDIYRYIYIYFMYTNLCMYFFLIYFWNDFISFVLPHNNVCIVKGQKSTGATTTTTIYNLTETNWDTTKENFHNIIFYLTIHNECFYLYLLIYRFFSLLFPSANKKEEYNSQ